MIGVWLGRQRALTVGVAVLSCALALVSSLSNVAAAPTDCADRSAACASPGTAVEADFKPAAAERWIEVDLDEHVVLLHAGDEVIERLPAATGRNDTPGTTTYPGVFRIYSKAPGLSYLPRSNVYVRDWVGFDSRWGNGFHSFPLDAHGDVIDSRVGLDITDGCVRTAASSTIYRFSSIGMRVVVRRSAGSADPPRRATPRWQPRAV